MSSSPRILGFLPTYRRRNVLADTLGRLTVQTRPCDALYVIDNEASESTRQLVLNLASHSPPFDVHYLPLERNAGSAGGWAHGMTAALPSASLQDWFLALDDDDPPRTDEDLARVVAFAQSQRQRDPRVAAVGVVGAWINWRTGRITRIPDERLSGAVPVDYVGNGHLAMYSASAVQQVGVFLPDLFFGFTEVEYAIRLKRAGFTIYANGDLWREERAARGRLGLKDERSWRSPLGERRYYSMRNYVYIMKRYGRADLALKYAIANALLRPMYTTLLSPKDGCRAFALGCRAAYDGLVGRLGPRN